MEGPAVPMAPGFWNRGWCGPVDRCKGPGEGVQVTTGSWVRAWQRLGGHPGCLGLCRVLTLGWPRGIELREGGAGQGHTDPFPSLPAPRWWVRPSPPGDAGCAWGVKMTR